MGLDHSFLVFGAIYIEGFDQFFEVFDFEKFWSMNSPPALQLMRVLMVCLLKPILIGTKIEFFEILAIVTE